MANKIYYVYEWFIKESGEVFYVGKGKDNRFKSMKDRNETFKDIIRKNDCDVRIVSGNLEEDEAYACELHRTLELKSIKQAKANYVYGKNKMMSDDVKLKISNTLKGRVGCTKGMELTQEHKDKLSKAHTGKTLSETHRRNISKSLKGKRRSEEVKKKLSQSKKGKLNPMYGKKQSQETIQKRVKSLIGHTLSEEARNKISLANGKKVKQIDIETGDVIRIFNNCSEAGRILNINSSKISKVSRGEGKTSGGFRWEYV